MMGMIIGLEELRMKKRKFERRLIPYTSYFLLSSINEKTYHD